MTLSPSKIRKLLLAHKQWQEHYLIAGYGHEGRGCRLEIHGSELAGADLQDTFLADANLQDADLRGTILNYSCFHRADLRRADLRGTDFRWSSFQSAKMQDVDLRGADLRDAEFLNTDLRGAKLVNNIRTCRTFHGAKFTADALPWLILHPRWAVMKDTVQIEPI